MAERGEHQPGRVVDPQTSTEYALCVYSEAPVGLTTNATVPANALKWSGTSTGYKYADPAGAAGGIAKILLKGREGDRTKILVKGGGANLADPALNLVEPVTAQLVKTGSPPCWEATYSGSAVLVSDGSQFKAKAE